VYATDTEHYDGRIDENLVRLAEGADVLIYDSQYTPEEYAGTGNGKTSRRGWGHSTFVEGAKIARVAGASRLVLFHHDPGHEDAFVEEKEARAQELFPNTIAAREGMSLVF
jgi:ribonuclease BN (tRNA processing enzyme)